MAKNRVTGLESIPPSGSEENGSLGAPNGNYGPSAGETIHIVEGQPMADASDAAPKHLRGPGAGYVESLRTGDTKRRCSPPPDDETEAKAPLLWEVLTVDLYSDGSTRLLPEIVIRRASGVYEIQLRDHASRQKKSGALLTLATLVDALEALLCDPTRPWSVYDSWCNPETDKDGKPIKKKLDR